MYLEELCHFALPRPAAGDRSFAAAADLASWSLVEVARLNAMPASLRRVLDAAAVIGVVQPLYTDIWWRARQATRSCLNSPSTTSCSGRQGRRVPFKHGLTRRVVYAASAGPAPPTSANGPVAVSGEAIPAGPRRNTSARPWPPLGRAGRPTLAAHFAASWPGDRAMSGSSVDRAKIQYRATLGVIEQWPDSRETLYQAWRMVCRSPRAGLRVRSGCLRDPGCFCAPSELATVTRDLPGARPHAGILGGPYALYAALGSNRRARPSAAPCVALSTALDERHALMLQAYALLAQVHAASGQAAQAAHLFSRRCRRSAG